MVFHSVTEMVAVTKRCAASVRHRISVGRLVDHKGNVYTDFAVELVPCEQPENKIVVSKQLCWTCKKATGAGDCEWANSRAMIPVPDWDADPVYKGEVLYTYSIKGCPKFEEG